MPSTSGIVSAAGFLKNPAESRALGYRVNYITNPSFEVNTSDWVSLSGSTISRVTSEFNTGSACLQIANESTSGAQVEQRIPFLDGQGVYYFSAYVKLDSGATTANYYLRHIQYESLVSSTTVASGNIGTQSLSPGDGWVRLSGAVTRNPVANYFLFRVVTASTTNTDVFFVDSVMVEKSDSLGSYFDGSEGGFWTGTPHESFSGASPY
jgi:hypothetical protein